MALISPLRLWWLHQIVVWAWSITTMRTPHWFHVQQSGFLKPHSQPWVLLSQSEHYCHMHGKPNSRSWCYCLWSRMKISLFIDSEYRLKFASLNVSNWFHWFHKVPEFEVGAGAIGFESLAAHQKFRRPAMGCCHKLPSTDCTCCNMSPGVFTWYWME